MTQKYDYREKLISAYQKHKIRNIRSEEEILNQFDLAMKEIEMDPSDHSVMIDYFDKPKKYLDTLYDEIEDIETSGGIIEEKTKNLREREITEIHTNAIKGFILLLLMIFAYELVFTGLVVFGNVSGLSSFSSIFYPILGNQVNILSKLIEYIPHILELFTGIAAVHIFSKQNQLRLRTFVRIGLFIMETGVYMLYFLYFTPGSIFSGIVPSLLLFELIVWSRERYVDPIGDYWIDSKWYKVYIGILLIFFTLINSAVFTM